MKYPLISDMYKDAFGTRPSSDWLRRFHASPEAEQDSEWAYLCQEVEDSIDRERESHAAAHAAFEVQLTALCELGAADRAEAIRWTLEAEGLTEDVKMYGTDYACHHLGLSYGYLKEHEL